MALNQTNKLVWIVDTIYKARKITFEELGRQWPSGNDTIYCLDRIRGFRLSSHSFEYPKDFIPQEYFDGCFGIIADKECDIQKVRLKVSPGQANYLRDLPLHESQIETERTEEVRV